MIQFIVIVPLVAAGGLVGFLHERIHRQRLAARPSSRPTRGAPDVEDPVAEGPVVRGDDLGQIRNSERAAHIALGATAAGALFYPPLGIVSLPIVGYSAFNWLRVRYPSEPRWLKSPSMILAVLALVGSLATGYWVLAPLVLTIDLAARKRAAQKLVPGAPRTRSVLSRRGYSLRVVLFLLTNVAVLLLLTVVLALLGISTANLLGLAVFSLGFGMSGSFISLALSKWIAKRTTGARIIDQPGTETEQWLIDTVARHAQRAGIGMPEVAIFDSLDMNAFATGMKRNRALVAVSTGLIARMTPAEIEAVLGHELAHVANGDMVTLALIQGVLDTFVIFISRVVAGAIDSFISRDREGGGLGFIGYIVVVMVLQLTLGLLAMLIVMRFSRQREFRADAGGAELAGREEMIAALERLQKDSLRSQLPDRLAAFGIHSSPSRLARLFSSHPPLEERIAALRTDSARSITTAEPKPDIELQGA